MSQNSTPEMARPSKRMMMQGTQGSQRRQEEAIILKVKDEGMVTPAVLTQLSDGTVTENEDSNSQSSSPHESSISPIKTEKPKMSRLVEKHNTTELLSCKMCGE